uniref:MARVEL domain-containing protein n=1 Tax=Panagrolaimus sp. ES5 TaxID=591445 RepID=A0AC34FN78_9BILA
MTSMNGHRFMTLPTSLKPAILILVILTMIFAGSSSPLDGHKFTWSWFFWFTTIVQLIFIIVVIALFALEMERLMTMGRDAWPIAEIAYSSIFGIFTVINIFVVSGWHGDAKNSSLPVLAAISCFVLFVLYALGGFMMFRLWKGFVQSGASQNPTAATQPGNIQGMHPGI